MDGGFSGFKLTTRYRNQNVQYLEIVQVDSLLGVGHAEEGEDEEHGEDGPHEVPDRDDPGVPAKHRMKIHVRHQLEDLGHSTSWDSDIT